MKQHHHNHTALLVIACSTVLLVFAVYGYLRHSISVSLERVVEGRHKAAERDLDMQRQGSLLALYDESAGDRGRARSLFVPEDATISFIESVEALGPVAGSAVELSTIEADTLDEATDIGRISVQVEARGSWSSVMKTLMLAEGLPYGVLIRDVRIDSSGATSAKDRAGWRASFVVEALMTRPVTQSTQ